MPLPLKLAVDEFGQRGCDGSGGIGFHSNSMGRIADLLQLSYDILHGTLPHHGLAASEAELGILIGYWMYEVARGITGTAHLIDDQSSDFCCGMIVHQIFILGAPAVAAVTALFPDWQIFDALYCRDIKGLEWQNIGVRIGWIHLTESIALQITTKESYPDTGLASQLGLSLKTIKNFTVSYIFCHETLTKLRNIDAILRFFTLNVNI